MSDDRPRYYPSVVQSADKLARYIRAMHEPHGHLIMQDVITQLLHSKGPRDEFARSFRAWLSYQYPGQVITLTSWSLMPGVTASYIVESLERFGSMARLVCNSVGLMRTVATGFRTTYAWAQGHNAGKTGFDIFGALNYVCAGQVSAERLAFITALRSYLQNTGYPRTIAEWNDEPGRTKDEVIYLLELCAANMEIV
jgi:hypothetical protein